MLVRNISPLLVLDRNLVPMYVSERAPGPLLVWLLPPPGILDPLPSPGLLGPNLHLRLLVGHCSLLCWVDHVQVHLDEPHGELQPHLLCNIPTGGAGWTCELGGGHRGEVVLLLLHLLCDIPIGSGG